MEVLHRISPGFGRTTFPGASPVEGGLCIAATISPAAKPVVLSSGFLVREQADRVIARKNTATTWTVAGCRRGMGLVAAGVVLRGDQDQARTRRCGLRVAAECVEDADDGCICRNHAQPNRRDYSDGEKHGHEERDHGRPTLKI